MIRLVSSAIASIELRTLITESWPTAGTIIGGCGTIPEKTMALSFAIPVLHTGSAQSHRRLSKLTKLSVVSNDGTSRQNCGYAKKRNHILSQRIQLFRTLAVGDGVANCFQRSCERLRTYK